MFNVAALSATDVSAWDIAAVAAKVSLLTFIIAGVVTIILVRRKRLREAHEEFMSAEVEELLRRGGTTTQPGYEAFIHGAMPNTPWPDWTSDDGHDDPPPTVSHDESS
jgi:membrane protein implicated in regulation of membrane protease activity